MPIKSILTATVTFLVLGVSALGAGDEPTLAGTIAGPSDVFLNGVCFAFVADTVCDVNNSPGLGLFKIDTNFFYGNVPGNLFTGSYTGPIAGVIIDPSTPAGTYSGKVTLLGGSDTCQCQFEAVGTGDFQLVVTPESVSGRSTGTLRLLGPGIIVRQRYKGLVR